MNRERQIVEALIEWHEKNRRKFPWRDESDPYKVVVAEFFLQRTPANRVAKIFPDFIQQYPNPKALANANLCYLIGEYRSLGLVKRMKWLIGSMKIICDKHWGDIPKSKSDLMNLPGIGEYTASAILCFGFKENIEIVDVNIFRLYSRYFGILQKKVREKAKSVMPLENGVQYNEALLDYSSMICKKNPLCKICVVKKECKYLL